MLGQLTVLVVDDDPGIQDVLATFLKSKGHRVETRSCAREGLDALRDDDFDLVISDIKMAGMNGFEFLHIARTSYPSIGIVLMTAYEKEFPFSEALRAGADGYISKPFTLKKFSLIFDQAYWNALSRQDWWEDHKVPSKQ